MDFRDLQDMAGRMFRAGMGAEAIRDLLRNISLDELANNCASRPIRLAARGARRRPSACAWWRPSASRATAPSG